MVIIRYYVNVYWVDDDEDEGIECGRQERRGGTGEKELKYLAGAHAMHTVEDEGGINTNSLKVNDELAYLAGAHAIHSFYTKGVISSAINSIIPPKLHS